MKYKINIEISPVAPLSLKGYEIDLESDLNSDKILDIINKLVLKEFEKK